MRSSDLAARAGVNVQTLRYYERRGLIEEPRRSLGGHRDYSDDDLTVVRAIKAAQRLGFTLEEIDRLIRSGAHLHNDATLQSLAREKLVEVESRIDDLHAVAAALKKTMDADCANLENCAAPRLS
jgi:DNA-binding transcriptional MerR regulator